MGNIVRWNIRRSNAALVSARKKYTYLTYILGASLFFGTGVSACLAQAPLAGSETSHIASLPFDPEEKGEFTAFDLYVGDRYYGDVYGYFGDGWFSFDVPEDILLLLPDLKDKAAVLPLIQGVISGKRVLDNVGEVHVFTNSFKIDIKIDKALSLKTYVNAFEALPKATKILAMRNKASVAGSTALNQTIGLNNLTFNHDTSIGRGRTRLGVAGSYSDAASYELRGAAIDHDVYLMDQYMTASAGMLQTQGQRFSRSLDIMGVHLGTNKVLLRRDPLLQASDVEVFLRTRSRVEVFRDSETSGRTLFSKIMEFGTVEVDTRNFPIGSYDVEIVITDSDGLVTRETRPFSKSHELLPRSKLEVNLDVGITRDDLDLTSAPAVFLGLRKRLTDTTEGMVSLYGTDEDVVIETTVKNESYFTSFGLVETSLTGAVNDRGRFSGIAGSVGMTHDLYSLRVSATRSYAEANGLVEDGSLALSARESLNASFSMPLHFIGRGARFGFSGDWSDSSNGSSYRYGPEFSMDLFRGDHVFWALKTQYTVTDDDNQIQAAITMRRTPVGAWQQTFSTNYGSNAADDRMDMQGNMTFDGVAGGYKDWRHNLKAFAGLRLSPIMSTAGDDMVSTLDTNIKYKGKWLATDAFLTKGLSEGGGRIGGELSTNMIWSSEGFFHASSDGVSRDGAFLMIEIKGDAKNAQVAVEVNGNVRARGYAGESVSLSLPTYQVSHVTVREYNDGGFAFVQDADIEIVAYPGNVFRRSVQVMKKILISGRLVDIAGNSLFEARFLLPDGASYTDDEGYFDIEVSALAEEGFVIEAAGLQCQIPEKIIADDEIVYDVGEIVCTP